MKDYCYCIKEMNGCGHEDWILSSYIDIESILKDAVADIYYHYDDKKTQYIVEIATCEWYEDTIDADLLIENAIERANDEFFDMIDGYLENVNVQSLQEKLDKVWKEWKKEENIQSPFFYPSDETSLYIIEVNYNKEKDIIELVNYKTLDEYYGIKK